MKYLKIVLSVLFVLLIAFFAAKGFMQVWREHSSPARRAVSRPTLEPKPDFVAVRPVPKGKMAIILDDWGNSSVVLKQAIAIGRPLTLSVLPHLPFSSRISRQARQNGLGVMLHMPMEAKNPNQPLEPHTILTTSSDAEIIKFLEDALRSVPEAEGVNNHQGSAATSDTRVMKTVLQYLKKRGLFFIDSEVIATSVGGKVAKETGIAFAKRDVFIDNVATVEAVKTKLLQAQKIALKYGQAVVIGHDKKPTLEAIREMIPEFDKNGIELVLVRELLKK